MQILAGVCVLWKRLPLPAGQRRTHCTTSHMSPRSWGTLIKGSWFCERLNMAQESKNRTSFLPGIPKPFAEKLKAIQRADVRRCHRTPHVCSWFVLLRTAESTLHSSASVEPDLLNPSEAWIHEVTLRCRFTGCASRGELDVTVASSEAVGEPICRSPAGVATPGLERAFSRGLRPAAGELAARGGSGGNGGSSW